MTAQSTKAIWNTQVVKRAILDSFLKLDPRRMMRNPVMFVVEVGSVITTLELIRGNISSFEVQITLWLWFTVLFANFAEAMAEGRGKAQAASLRNLSGLVLKLSVVPPIARTSRSAAGY